MSTTKDLIDAIYNGDSVEIESAFNTAMAERVADKLETMRVDLASDMFNEEVGREQVKYQGSKRAESDAAVERIKEKNPAFAAAYKSLGKHIDALSKIKNKK